MKKNVIFNKFEERDISDSRYSKKLVFDVSKLDEIPDLMFSKDKEWKKAVDENFTRETAYDVLNMMGYEVSWFDKLYYKLVDTKPYIILDDFIRHEITTRKS